MRKVLAILLLFTFLYTPVQARGPMMVYGIVNNAGGQLVTTIPITTIVPKKHRIYGISIVDRSGGGSPECFASISDVVPDGSGGTVAEIVAENETDTGGGTKWFTYSLSITTQVTVHQGSFTEVLISFAR